MRAERAVVGILVQLPGEHPLHLRQGLALGAGRWQLVRVFLVESLLLTLIAGGLGLLLAVQGTRFLVALYGDSLPRGANVGADGTAVIRDGEPTAARPGRVVRRTT